MAGGRLFGLCLAALLGACSIAHQETSASPLPSGWSRFTESGAGFSIAAPAGWQQKTVSSGAFTLVDAAEPDRHAAMHVEETQEAKDIFAFKGAVDAYVSQIGSDGTTVSRTKVKLPAGQAERLQYTTTAQTSIGPHAVTYTEFVLFHYVNLKGTVFHVAFVTLAENAQPLSSTFQKMAETFQYLS